jgi:YhcH/YjgK/YiaL family protein
MILGTLDTWMRYDLGPAWRAAFAFLANLAPDVAGGRHPVPCADAPEGSVYVEVGRYDAMPEGSGRLEAHRRHIDIQYVLSGMEWLDWTPLSGLEAQGPYAEDRDVRFFSVTGRPCTRVLLQPGVFAALFPEDAHMPGIAVPGAATAMVKAVAKVRVDALAVAAIGGRGLGQWDRPDR